WLLAAVMVALLFSPPLTSALELSLYALMLGNAALRSRLARAAREPLALLAFAFWAFVGLGVAYSGAPLGESLGIFVSWRRLLLLVVGLALFDDPAWKQRLALVLVVIATLCAVASYAVAFLDIQVRQYLPGVVLRTHSFQGMLFAVAAFTAAVLLVTREFSPRSRIALGTATFLLVANVVFITPGRSGYLVLVVLTLAFGLGLLRTRGSMRRLALGIGVTAAVIAMLTASPIVRQRIDLALQEAASYEQGNDISSIGERIIYMRNAVELIGDRPLFGHGTGAFATAYARMVDGRHGREGIKIHDPHNQYLNVTVEHGFAGLTLFLAILVAAFRQEPAPPYRLLGLAVLAAWCLTSLFSSHFSTFAEGRFIWLWLGACLARRD
ncbi:MAG: O-antigen ligase family protein, partial [Betaproteobacteria bacterium]